jgi:Tat protein translocase TatB subunit
MFGIGMPELILIAVVALIVLGPKKLPDLAQSLGRALREFKKATSELKETLQVDGELSEVKKAFNEFQSDVNQSINPRQNRETRRRGPPAVSEPDAGCGSSPATKGFIHTGKVDDLNKAFEARRLKKNRSPNRAGKPGGRDSPPPKSRNRPDSAMTRAGLQTRIIPAGKAQAVRKRSPACGVSPRQTGL